MPIFPVCQFILNWFEVQILPLRLSPKSPIQKLNELS
jgi:hypothetical protein